MWNLHWCENEYVGMNFGMKPGECLVLVSKSKGRGDFTDISLCKLQCVLAGKIVHMEHPTLPHLPALPKQISLEIVEIDLAKASRANRLSADRVRLLFGRCQIASSSLVLKSER